MPSYFNQGEMAMVNTGMPLGNEKTKLIVNYLPQDMTERDLAMMFYPYGNITSVRLVRDRLTGHSYGYGFVSYERESSAYKALHVINGFEIGNKKLKVSFARPSGDDFKDTNLYITNLPRNIVESELKELFEPYGCIVQHSLLKDKVTGLPRGVAFVRFNKREEAELALQSLNGKLVEGSREPLKIKVANAPKHKAVGHYYGSLDHYAPRYLPFTRGRECVEPGCSHGKMRLSSEAVLAVGRPPFADETHEPLSAELGLLRSPYYSPLPLDHELKDDYGPLHHLISRGHDYLRPSCRYNPIRGHYSRAW